jgi:hypothetical protein
MRLDADAQTFAKLYPALRPGELIDGTSDARFREAWAMARAAASRRLCHEGMSFSVIASEATCPPKLAERRRKQSRSQEERLDCFVASAFARRRASADKSAPRS